VDGVEVDTSSIPTVQLPDPDDAAFLEVALASSSDFLVTGNISHFPAESRRGCRVASPAEFVAFWNSKNDIH
jgi:predicted nucleic acid-binding protein